jgi:hypothetical protein
MRASGSHPAGLATSLLVLRRKRRAARSCKLRTNTGLLTAVSRETTGRIGARLLSEARDAGDGTHTGNESVHVGR